MQPHEERVVTERAELAAKVEKLGPFIDGPVFLSIDLYQQHLLKEQYHHMRCYLAILDKRIETFGVTDAPARA